MNVLVWGTGRITEKVLSGLEKEQIIGYIESAKSRETYNGKRVYEASELPDDFDIILVANQYGDAIHECCLTNGIALRKVCFMKPISHDIDIENNLRLAKLILTSDWYDKVCSEFGRVENNWIADDAQLYSKLNRHSTMEIMQKYNMPIYTDRIAMAGSINSYFWQDLWAARKIYRESPQQHYDIGSRIDGFIAHLLTFRNSVNLIDIRPLDREVNGLNFICADATNLNNFADNSIESLSALCSLEHFGLGRYGDAIDPDACYKCFDAIGRKVRVDGNVYLSVPVGKEHLEFNAHRVFYASTIISAFTQYELIEYSCTNQGFIEYNVDVHKYDNDISIGGARFGLFHFRKRY